MSQSVKFHHEWGFMGNDDTDNLGDWIYCPLCDQWSRTFGDKPFKMSKEKYQEMIKSGRITGV